MVVFVIGDSVWNRDIKNEKDYRINTENNTKLNRWVLGLRVGKGVGCCVLRRAKQEKNSMPIDKLIFLVVTNRKEKSQEREQGEVAELDLASISVCIDMFVKNDAS